jgi:hypothetical protein
VPRQLYLVQRSHIAFSTVALKHLCDIFIQFVGIEVVVLMDEEESVAAQKSRLLVFLHEEILEVKIHAHLHNEVHAHIREKIFAGNDILGRRTEWNRGVHRVHHVKNCLLWPQLQEYFDFGGRNRKAKRN